MTLRDYTANVISASKVVPDGAFQTSAASGVWDINEALDLIKGGNWPTTGNFDPAAFVDGLFSTDLWTSDGSSTQTITNNIDLSNKGGLVWIKDRSTAKANVLVDTARISGNTDNYLMSDAANGQTAHSNEFGDFTSTGYTIPRNTEAGYTNTNTGRDYVGWTFRKQPKFFDIVTYTGTGSAQAISHNLGSVPGMIITKATGIAYNWGVYHRSLGSTKALTLDTTGASATGSEYWNDTDPTSTHFTVKNANQTGDTGQNYVAYLFAHNNNDGGFGEPGDQDIIKCGTFATDSSGNATVTLGFEPQFVMNKVYDAADNWTVADNMRGFGADGDQRLYWNLNNAEAAATTFRTTSTGFTVNSGETSKNYVYMAIRRGGMQTPSTPSDVFHVQSQSDGSTYSVGFPTDLILLNKTGGSSANSYVGSRLTGNDRYLVTNTNSAEASSSNLWTFDGATTKNDFDQGASTSSAWVGWHWARARGYFDVVTYTGTGSARTVDHNLDAVPEMIWVKRRDSGGSWGVWHEDLTSGYYLGLDTNDPELSNSNVWTTTNPTATQFSVGTQGFTNASGGTFIAYLFATVAGVSKVGSFTATGSDVNVDCGFTNGAKFVLIKRTNSADDWFIFRDIVAGNDKRIKLNTTDAEATGSDNIDPLSSGFTMTSGILGDSGNEFIFYAIANDPS